MGTGASKETEVEVFSPARDPTTNNTVNNGQANNNNHDRKETNKKLVSSLTIYWTCGLIPPPLGPLLESGDDGFQTYKFTELWSILSWYFQSLLSRVKAGASKKKRTIVDLDSSDDSDTSNDNNMESDNELRDDLQVDKHNLI